MPRILFCQPWQSVWVTPQIIGRLITLVFQGGWDSGSVDVRPYAVALYEFSPQFENELPFKKDDVIFLLQHVDNEWLEGEIDGVKGIFPGNKYQKSKS